MKTLKHCKVLSGELEQLKEFERSLSESEIAAVTGGIMPPVEELEIYKELRALSTGSAEAGEDTSPDLSEIESFLNDS